jgi:hypothetical protein
VTMLGTVTTSVRVGAAVSPPVCPWCSYWHPGVCPKVRVIEFYPDGTVSRVEFHGAEGATVPRQGRLKT